MPLKLKKVSRLALRKSSGFFKVEFCETKAK